MASVRPPADSENWIAVSADPLPVADASAWVVHPRCGAVVSFVGTARDHAPGRPNVTELEYEAYESQAVSRMEALADEIHRRWPVVGRVAMLHRVGSVELTDAAVLVAVSSPHRAEAFESARFGIDALKATVPIWKKESWDGGASWGTDAQHLTELHEFVEGDR